MRKSAFVLVAATFAGSFATSVNAEMLSSDGVIYTYGSDSLLADPYATVDYGTVESVYLDETSVALSSDYVTYEVSETPFTVVEDSSVASFETVEVDPYALTVYNSDVDPNGVGSEVIDGVVYESIMGTEMPMIESGQIIQTY